MTMTTVKHIYGKGDLTTAGNIPPKPLADNGVPVRAFWDPKPADLPLLEMIQNSQVSKVECVFVVHVVNCEILPAALAVILPRQVTTLGPGYAAYRLA
jgi:hypothetical protein